MKQQRHTSSEDDFFSSAGSLPRHLLRSSISSGGLQASQPARTTVRATSRSPQLSIRYIQTAFLTASLVHRPHPAHVRGSGHETAQLYGSFRINLESNCDSQDFLQFRFILAYFNLVQPPASLNQLQFCL